MPTQSRAQVAYAMIEFADDRLAPTNWAEALRSSLAPGTWVERYGRRWYIAQWNESRDGRWLDGRLAYERAGEERPTIWDAERNDVREIPGMLMQVVPYVVDMNERRAAFQLRGEAVKPGAFQGNFQALIQKASNLAWRIRLEGVPQLPWEEWRKTRVRHLTGMWITMTPPNPHTDIAEIEELFDRGVSSAQMVARGTDIDLEGADLLRVAFHHAQTYGKISAEAVTVDGGKEHWKSEEEGGVRKDEAERDPTGHVPPEELRRLLRHRADVEGEAE